MPNSPTGLASPLAEARRKIDEEIKRLRVQVLALSTARNALAPISRLPTELHIAIFSLAVETSPAKGLTGFSLSAVSKQWRDLALSIPYLWASIDVPNARWIQESFTRSGDLPLSISIAGLCVDMACLFETMLITPHIARVESLALACTSAGTRLDSDRQIPNHSPFVGLKRLQLQSFRVNDTIFLPKGSLLEDVSLQDCVLDYNSLSTLSHLRVLSIIDPGMATPIDTLMRTLQSLPALQVFKTRNALTFGDSGIVDYVELPDFLSLSVHDEPLPLITSIIHSINSHRVPDVSISGGFDFPYAIYSLLEAWRRARATNLSAIHSTTALHILAREEQLSIKVTEVETPLITVNQATNPPRRISSELTFNTETGTAKIAEVALQYISLDNLEELELAGSSYGPDPSSSWWQTLGSLEKLRTLIVRNRYAPEFVNFLVQESDPYHPQDDILHTPSPLSTIPQAHSRPPSPNSISFRALKTLIYEESKGNSETIQLHINQLILVLQLRIPFNLVLNNLVVIVKYPLNRGNVEDLTNVAGDFRQMVRRKGCERAELIRRESFPLT